MRSLGFRRLTVNHGHNKVDRTGRVVADRRLDCAICQARPRIEGTPLTLTQVRDQLNGDPS